jgi:hypothetical protein
LKAASANAGAYQQLQAALDFPVTSGTKTYEEIGPIQTFVYLPESTPMMPTAQPARDYASWFYRTKNKAFKILHTKLDSRGLYKPPTYHNLPMPAVQENRKAGS